MALSLSTGEILKMKAEVESAKRRAKAITDKVGDSIETVVRTAEVGAAAFALGVVNGKFNGIKIVGIPVDLLSGVALHTLGFMGVGGKNAEHLHAFGDGAIASFAVTMGREFGYRWQVGGGAKLPSGMQGAQSEIVGSTVQGARVTGGAGVADAELERMVRAGV